MEFPFSSMNLTKVAARKVWQVVHQSHLPEWMCDNEYIHHGHRPPTPSFVECYKSIFRIHTHTANIWSHLIGTIIFIGITVYFLNRPVHQIRWEDKLAYAPFLAGAIVSFGLSSIFHTVHCHSEMVTRFFNKLDYVGILFLCIVSFVPWLHYGFYYRPDLKIVYTIIIISLRCLCSMMILSDKFTTTKYRTLRNCIFSALGSFALIPSEHFYFVHGYHTSFEWLIVTAAFYIGGAIIYASQIPERFSRENAIFGGTVIISFIYAPWRLRSLIIGVLSKWLD